jgi:hypothetical protein
LRLVERKDYLPTRHRGQRQTHSTSFTGAKAILPPNLGVQKRVCSLILLSR